MNESNDRSFADVAARMAEWDEGYRDADEEGDGRELADVVKGEAQTLLGVFRQWAQGLITDDDLERQTTPVVVGMIYEAYIIGRGSMKAQIIRMVERHQRGRPPAAGAADAPAAD